MPPPRTLASLACIVAALYLAGPQTVAFLRHRTAWGLVREVVVTPVDAGRARLSVLYEVQEGGKVGRQGEVQGGTTWLAWGQDGGRYAVAPDPVLPVAEAQARAERLRSRIEGERCQLFRVFYQANDPAGTAFIQIPDGQGLSAYHLGMICVLASLVLCLRIPRRRR